MKEFTSEQTQKLKEANLLLKQFKNFYICTCGNKIKIRNINQLGQRFCQKCGNSISLESLKKINISNENVLNDYRKIIMSI